MLTLTHAFVLSLLAMELFGVTTNVDTLPASNGVQICIHELENWAIARSNEVVRHAVPWTRQVESLRTAVTKKSRSGPTTQNPMGLAVSPTPVQEEKEQQVL